MFIITTSFEFEWTHQNNLNYEVQFKNIGKLISKKIKYKKILFVEKKKKKHTIFSF